MIINLLARVYAIAITFTIVWYINHFYSTEALGKFGLFLIFTQIIKTIALMGVSQGIIYVDKKEIDLDKNGILRISVFCVSISLGLVISTIAIQLFWRGIYDGSTFLILVTELVFIDISLAYILIDGRDRMYGALSYAIEPTVYLSALISFHGAEVKLESLSAFSFGVLAIIIAIILILNSSIRFRPGQVIGLFYKLFDLYRSSLTFSVINIIQYVSLELDKLLLNMLLSAKEVGVYMIIDKISRLTIIVFNTLAPLTKNMFSIVRNDIELTTSLFFEYRRLVVFLSLPISLFLIFISRVILDAFGGYGAYYYLLAILISARTIQYGSGYTAVLLQMSALKNYDILANLLKISLLSAGGFVFVEAMGLGLLGMMIAVFTTILCVSFLQVRFINYKYNVSFLHETIYYIAPVFLVVIYAKEKSVGIEILTFSIITISIIWLLKKAWEQYQIVMELKTLYKF